MASGVLLVAVGRQDLGIAQHVIVTNQREEVVTDGVLTDHVEPDAVADSEAGLGDLVVACQVQVGRPGPAFRTYSSSRSW